MPSQKPTIMIRTTLEIKRKLEYVCKIERRSMSNQIEKLIIDLIQEFEKEHGTIELETPIEEPRKENNKERSDRCWKRL